MLRRIFVLLTCCCVSLSACKTKPQSQTGQGQPGPLALGQAFQLKIGQTAKFAGDEANAALSVTFSALLSESRCPSVTCVWSGEARVLLEVVKGSMPPVQFELSTLPDTSNFNAANYRFEMQAVEPYPETPEQDFALEDYVLTLLVRPLTP